MPSVTCSSVDLRENWSFRRGGRDANSEWLPVQRVPTEVHLDLQKNGKIADPFVDLNELSVRWMADEAWTYRTKFSTPENLKEDGVRADIVFEGLDTFAQVWLNEKVILESDNMFVAHRVEISSDLKADAENTLEIVFESARKKGLEMVEQHSEHKFIVHQTEVSRGPVRKAQYQWGWDWGPILLTAGPWKPVRLETYSGRIEDIWVEYHLSDDFSQVEGKVKAKVNAKDGKVILGIHNPEGQKGFEVEELQVGIDCLNDIYEAKFLIKDAPLWWPRGYGPQSLHTITANLVTSEAPYSIVHQASKHIGFRKVDLVQEKDEYGQSFYFRINGADIFVGGSCWIPADSFLSTIEPQRYRDWMKLAAEGNQLMVRIWGGGIYEADPLYDACNELGLLVWQDFAFACANYPAYPEYLKSIELEARQNVRRLRHHPSLVIWAGNNEDYQIVERYGLEYRFKEDKDPQSWLKTDFPARYIYEHLLPKIVSEETVGVPYHPSSPFGNGTSTVLKVDPSVGDIHQWNMWHGTMEPYQQLPQMGGRFVSEFGMEAYPHLQTIQRSITREEDRYPGSMAMDFRNKAIGHERRLVSYVAENFLIKYDLPSFTHLTQIVQADAMTWAYKSWRRQWGVSGKRKCGGVLVWQLNDCWPTMSWAIADYYLIPKPAHYAIKRTLQPTIVGVSRKWNSWIMRPADKLWKRDTSHIDMRKLWEDIEFDVWVVTNRNEKVEATVIVKFISVKSGKEIQDNMTKTLVLEPNGTTEVFKDAKAGPQDQDQSIPFDTNKADPFVVQASLIIEGNEIATDISWPDPIKYLNFSARGVEVTYSEEKNSVSVKTSKPVKAFVFSERQGVKLSDNGFDVLPGAAKNILVEGIGADELEWRYVGM